MVREQVDSLLPNSLLEINRLPEWQKHSIYLQLIPNWVFNYVGLASSDASVDISTHVIMKCSAGSRTLELSVFRDLDDIDPIIYLHLMDTLNSQILVLLTVVNDLTTPRFNIDCDAEGISTQLGTRSRNIQAEIAAMKAGLAPGQVRKGLRAFRQMIPVFESFVNRMGHPIFFIEPLAYHNAILFERYGFNYLKGQGQMIWIDREFKPGGILYCRLDSSTPFRQLEAASSVRGRSWAIHDGILGYPFTDFRMYKHVGKRAGVTTISEIAW